MQSRRKKFACCVRAVCAFLSTSADFMPLTGHGAVRNQERCDYSCLTIAEYREDDNNKICSRLVLTCGSASPILSKLKNDVLEKIVLGVITHPCLTDSDSTMSGISANRQPKSSRGRGVNAEYAKFETFPIWNLPLKNPVNVAYEAATADIGTSISSIHFISMSTVKQLKELKGCKVHMTHIPTPGDEAGLRRLGVNLTSEPNFSTKNLFIP